MSLKDFKINLERFEHLIKSVESSKLKLKKKRKIFDFREKKISYYINAAKGAFKELKESLWNLNYLVKEDKNNEIIYLELIKDLKNIENNYAQENLKKVFEVIEKIKKNILKFKETEQYTTFDVKYIPLDVRADVNADLKELKKCYNAGCYRSSVILCGRLLEAALHRKYFEITGQDILEKNPGIGLGKLIAKLSEKNVNFDPGVREQIHVINKIRVESVHKKKEAFYPSKSQAYAIILFTMDVLEKLFK